MISDKCDFCHYMRPAWRYPCSSFTVLELQWESLSDWMACAGCAKFVEDGKLDDLAFLITGLLTLREVGDPTREAEEIHKILYGETLSVYKRFEANRKGARVLA